MELSKVINKTRDISGNIEQALAKDIDAVINVLYEDFDVCHRGSKQLVDKALLSNKLKMMFAAQAAEAVCCAILKSGTRCTRKSCVNSKYCKSHQMKQYLERQSHMMQDDKLFVLEKTHIEDVDKKQELRRQFVEDSFYLVDDNYVYNQDSLEKVGYVDSRDGIINYVLTDDPFILGLTA
jgi:hypothetical protein